MIFRPPKYSIIELGQILDKDPILPKTIDELIFEKELKNNTNLKWRINPYLQRKAFNKLFLSQKEQRRLKILTSFNWLFAFIILGLSLWTKDFTLLTALLVYPLFLKSGLLDHWIVIFNSCVLLAIEFIFRFHNHYFALIFVTFITAYLISRLKFEILEKSIFKKAFRDFKTFWKYYSKKLIFIDKTAIGSDCDELFKTYPELDEQTMR